MGSNEKTASARNQSSEKLIRIIEFLAEQKEAVRLLDISQNLGINSSTALRFLSTLINTGYAEQDSATSKYRLTMKFCTLAHKISSKISLRDIARPYMETLSSQFRELVCLAVEQGGQVVYVDTVQSEGTVLMAMQRIGSIAPMHCTAIGKLLLLNYSDEMLRKLAGQGLHGYTKHTITTFEGLMSELKQVREQGYAFDNEECELNARCVAFPIYDITGKVIAGMSITGPAYRLTDELIFLRMKDCLLASSEISAKMGYLV